MFLRTTICFKDIGRFEGKDKSLLYSDDYTGNHIAIFECELKAPPQIAMIDHTYTQFLDSYRMNFRNWKIVDVDNWMEGNHFFSELQEEKVWESKVDAVFKNTKDKTIYLHEDKIDQPNYHEEHLLPFIRAKNNEIDQLDTRGNRNMSPLHKRRIQVALDAAAAKEKAENGDKDSGKKSGKKAKKEK